MTRILEVLTDEYGALCFKLPNEIFTDEYDIIEIDRGNVPNELLDVFPPLRLNRREKRIEQFNGRFWDVYVDYFHHQIFEKNEGAR